LTVKVFAPCVVKKAMIQAYIEKQMDFKMFQSKMVEKMILKKIEMDVARKYKQAKEKANYNANNENKVSNKKNQ